MKKRFIIFAGILVVFWYHSVHSRIFVGRTTVSSVKPPETIPQHISDKTPFDVLLLGYGGATHEGPYLTDSMMDIHVDPKTQKIFLVSIPRDLWVSIPTNGTEGSSFKINAAYSIGLDDTTYPNKQAQFNGPDGGGRLADYFVGLDFSGFVKTIDTVGGVDINVQPAFDDPGYPNEASASATCGHSADDIQAFTATVSAESDIWAYFPCRYETVHFDAGPQHMDGARALIYVRSRHSAQDGTDFGRARRQRNLAVAVEQKIFSISFIPNIIPFMNSLKDDVRTDLAPSDIQALIQHAQNFQNYQVVSLALTDQNYLIDTLSSTNLDILVPKDGQDNYTNIHSWIAGAFAGKPEPVPAIVQVENGTTIAGLAQTVTTRLAGAHIQTLSPTNAGGAQAARTTIIAFSQNINPSDIALLEKELNVKDISHETATASGYNIRVVVGSDYKDSQQVTPPSTSK
jgi:LCP family protein required for cell wall assembly